MTNSDLLVFVSYSRRDLEIARLLDASLLANGIPTFRDERDILVGESFPDRIYGAIASATHLLYVLSTNSVESQWVQEELSAAKVKEKEVRGFKVLPVLIDDVSVPVGLRHIHYADFRGWRNPDSYRRCFLEILRAMGISPKLLGSDDLKWYAAHSSEVRRVTSELNEICGLLHGGLAAQLGRSEGESVHYMPAKWAIYENDVLAVLNQLLGMLREPNAPPRSTRLEALKSSAEGAVSYVIENFKGRLDLKDPHRVDAFWRLLRTTVAMLEEARSETELALLASVQIE